MLENMFYKQSAIEVSLRIRLAVSDYSKSGMAYGFRNETFKYYASLFLM